MRIALALIALLLGAPALAAPPPEVPRSAVTILPGLSYEVLRTGPVEGIAPTRADTVTVRYRGRLDNGKIFNTSADEGRGTTTFELAKLIPGWVAALQMMRPGDRWRLTIPSYLGYGHVGKPAHGIPPDATLTFEVELVSVTPAPQPVSPPKGLR
ncbi:MAG: FKBP-type peptidyl-prolyl cis-trans isomerase [Pseudomonadota bacterium]|nr:FKBP-type peptidyl-prolyl cis-trans isomerase [Pseudomonadota bacterium]